MTTTSLKNHDAVLLIGSDSPQLSPELIIQASDQLQDNQFVIGPAEDGGFYLFGGKNQIAQEVWVDTNYSVSTTANDLTTRLSSLSKIKWMDPHIDVDTYADLKKLSKLISLNCF